MKQYSAQHCDMPNIMTATHIIKRTGKPPLRDMGSIDDRPHDIDGDTLGERRVEVIRPGGAPCHIELNDGGEAGGAQGEVECYARPGHVGAVEGGPPGEDGAEDAEEGGQGHVDGAGDGFAVEGGPFGGEDGGGDEEGDAGVVDAGEAVEEGLIGDAVHGVPHGGAEEAFAGGAEEDGGDEHVGLAAGGEGGRGGVEVEGDGEDEEEAQGVRPDVDAFVGGAEDGGEAFEFGFGEAVAVEDVRVHAPGVGEVFVADQTAFCRLEEGDGDAFFQGVFGFAGAVEAFVDEFARVADGVVDFLPALVDRGGEVGVSGVGAGFQFREEALHQFHAGLGFLFEGFFRGDGVVET